MGRVRCIANGITVVAKEFGRTFVIGDEIDLDDFATVGVTWREALSDHVGAEFVAIDIAPAGAEGA